MKLRNCPIPWCQGEAEIEYYGWSIEGTLVDAAKCTSCGLKYQANEWNTRPNEDALKAAYQRVLAAYLKEFAKEAK